MVKVSIARQKSDKRRSGNTGRRLPSGGTFIEPKLRELEAGTPDHIERERLLGIMRDETKLQSERDQAAIEALPFCYIKPNPIVTVRHRIHLPKARKR